VGSCRVTIPTVFNAFIPGRKVFRTVYIDLVLLMASCRAGSIDSSVPAVGMTTQKEVSMKYNALTPEEKWVIIDKGTERPFSGKYYLNKEKGVYQCKQCGAELFRSDAKFDSGTGWPSFDDAIPGAVREKADPDGRRIEILCATCGGHLGHVFYNEGFTSKNARYCVNSISLSFEPADKPATKTEKAVFAGGCFWGVEYHFRKVPGVLSTTVGYAGGGAWPVQPTNRYAPVVPVMPKRSRWSSIPPLSDMRC
jgi:peptide methionine sulfoxide reductase msrA/msrB